MTDAEIDIAQHAAFVIDAQRHSGDGGDVADDHAEADGDQQQRLVILGDRQGDEDNADDDHQQMPPGQGHEAGILEKVAEQFHDDLSL